MSLTELFTTTNASGAECVLLADVSLVHRRSLIAVRTQHPRHGLITAYDVSWGSLGGTEGALGKINGKPGLITISRDDLDRAASMGAELYSAARVEFDAGQDAHREQQRIARLNDPAYTSAIAEARRTGKPVEIEVYAEGDNGRATVMVRRSIDGEGRISVETYEE